MARGGYGGRGVPLHARTRVDPASRPAPAPRPGGTGPSSPDPVARHCWVTDPALGGAPRPGLLVEWRRTVDGDWQGRVLHVAEIGTGRRALVEEWLDHALLSQGPVGPPEVR